MKYTWIAVQQHKNATITPMSLCSLTNVSLKPIAEISHNSVYKREQ